MNAAKAITFSKISIHAGMGDLPRGKNPQGRRLFRAAAGKVAFTARRNFRAAATIASNEKPRRNPKVPDGVFHAFTSRKVVALEVKTPEQRLRSGRFNIFLPVFLTVSASGSLHCQAWV